MNVTALLTNAPGKNLITVSTNGNEKSIGIDGKPDGKGSSVNGAELLFCAIATCFCNDLHREAARRKIEIESITVSVQGEFGGEGEPARKISYSVKIDSPNPKEEVDKLILDVDSIAEIHNTLRQGIAVTLDR